MELINLSGAIKVVCRDQLIKSIQAVHVAVRAYSKCIPSDETNDTDKQEQEVFQRFDLELSTQLATLRRMYIDKFNIDPITGRPQEILIPCNCSQVE